MPPVDANFSFTIRRFRSGEGLMLRNLRQEALVDSPDSFHMTPQEDAERTVASCEAQLAGEWLAADAGVLGAFLPDQTAIGMLGYRRESTVKARHRAMIWGVYVTPAFRGRAISRALTLRAIDDLRAVGDIAWIDLTVSLSAASAQKLYDSLGFEVYGISRDALRWQGRSVDEQLRTLRLH